MARRLAAILFTDVVEYTALMGRDEAAARRVRARHEDLVREHVSRYHGEWIEEKGDESLSVFPSALDAVHCALAIRAELAQSSGLELRIAGERYDLSLGAGLMQLAGRVFRIGHLGDLNEVMCLGAIAGVEMAMRDVGIPFEPGSGTAAAGEGYRSAASASRGEWESPESS